MNKWEKLIKEFWVSKFAPDQFTWGETQVVKSFAEFLQTKESAQPSVQRTCSYCGGSGWKPGSHSGTGVKCGECGGTGASR